MKNKEQHSILNSVGKDEPLLVMRYKPWKVAWRLFFPYSMGIPLFYMIVFHWAPRKPGFFVPVFLEIVGILALVGGAWLLADMLLTIDFKLYGDRVEKTYRLFGIKQVKLNNADVILTPMYWRNIYVLPKGSYYVRLRNRVSFDCNLMDSKCLEDFKKACKLVGIEFARSRDGLTGVKSDHNKRG